jgi:hypothetical protein
MLMKPKTLSSRMTTMTAKMISMVGPYPAW